MGTRWRSEASLLPALRGEGGAQRRMRGGATLLETALWVRENG
jgi:hypothetical protein